MGPTQELREGIMDTATKTITTTTGLRSIEGVYKPPRMHWVGDGFRVAGYFNAIPNAMERLDPFLMLDYHPTHVYAPSPRPRGVGVHPHRGFETVTIAWQGSVAHHDSTGGGGVIGPGDAQWMTAAGGILHKEYHEAEFSKQGGPFQMAQLWVNLPKRDKMSAPGYQAITAEQMGVATLPDGAGTVRVLAGSFADAKGPARTFTPMNVLDVRLAKDGDVTLPIPASHNLAMLVMKGAVRVGDETLATHEFVVFANDGDHVALTASEEAQLLVLSGEPIGEPIVQYGPFVMNTEQEIVQAFEDLRAGRFGHLAD
jgi:redox-sensitive bicupin YhaK (pirin superfamily)